MPLSFPACLPAAAVSGREREKNDEIRELVI